MRRKGFTIIDYIDDYVGVGVPSVAWASFHALLDLMTQLGLTVSVKKLVRPATQATCLGVLIDTEKGTISIPPEKLRDVTDAVRHQKIFQRLSDAVRYVMRRKRDLGWFGMFTMAFPCTIIEA